MTEDAQPPDQRLHEFDAMFALAPMMARVVDLSGSIERANPLADEEFTDAPPTTLRQLWERRSPTRLFGSEPVAFVQTSAMRALAGAIVRNELTRVVGGDGSERYLECSASPIVDDAARVTGAVLLDVDVTARVRSERAQIHVPTNVSTDDAERAAHDRAMAVIAHVTAIVIHDVNNALNPIMSAAYLLRHHAESPNIVRDYADRIRLATEAGSAIASRLGRFVRQAPLHQGGGELIQLSSLIDDVLAREVPPSRSGNVTDGGVSVERHDSDPFAVRGIEEDLRHALRCLVRNALEAMPGGGALQIATERDGAFVRVTVQDSGVGMSAVVRSRACEPFFSTKNVPGAGLGLAEVYSIVKRHGGTTTIASAPGAGTTVTLRLPIATDVTSPADAGPSTTARPLTILIAEDHDDGREFLSRVLHSNGHTVDAVASCAAARAKLAADGVPIYNLLLTDVSLPDGSGWDLLTFVKQQYPKVRVGIVTGWEPSIDSEVASGAEFILRKPLRATELLLRVEGGRTTQALE